MASNDRISKKMNLKGFGRKRLWPNFNTLQRHSPGGTQENHKQLSQGSRSPSRDLNLRPPEYKAGVLTSCRVDIDCKAQKHPIQFVQGVLSSQAKRSKYETDHSSPFSVDENTCCYNFIPPIRLHRMVQLNTGTVSAAC
jgi:hypothetical protein